MPQQTTHVTDLPGHVLMRVDNLSVRYKTRAGWVSAVDKVSFDIYKGEVLGLVGESGCGKSTMGKALMRMNPKSAQIDGNLWFHADTTVENLMPLSNREMRKIRGRNISMVFQDPMTSLNPVQRIVNHITETILTHKPGTSEETARKRAEELVDVLGISSNRLDDYPHQLSGGMRQRIMIALALSLNSNLIVADEATTSLDVIVEAQFMNLLRDLAHEFNLTILLITHNIGLVAQLADRVAVMYAGRLAEIGGVRQIFKNPQHPYTEGLLKAVPSILLDDDEDLYRMSGSPPDLITPPAGCRFHPRCPKVLEVCHHERPALVEVDEGQWAHCWLHQDVPEKYQQKGTAAS